MAVTSTVNSVTASIKLNIGTGPDGTRKTKSINISGLKKAAFSNEDKQKLMNIVDAMSPVLNYSIYETTMTTREVLDNE